MKKTSRSSAPRNASRRRFLVGTAAAGGGLALGFHVPFPVAAAERRPAGLEREVNAWVLVRPDDTCVIRIARSEMGQGTLTGLAQMVAEELECDWSKVRMQVAPVDPASFGHQTTVGSQAIRTTWEPLRRAGAEAREMLIQAAAQQWDVDKGQCRAENGFVINTATNARLSYGALTQAASKLPVPQNVALKDPKQFKIIGKPLKKLDTRDKVLGKAVFGMDVRREGMLYAVMEQCPVFGGKAVSFDASKAKTVPGVKNVVMTSRGVAVIADSTWSAMQGRKLLSVQWDEGAGADVSSASIRQMFVQRASEKGAAARKEGDVAAGLAKAERS